MFVALLAVAGDGLYYVFGVHLPGRERAGARDEIERWEQRLATARRCLLGESPASPTPSEALAVYEMSHDVDHHVCTPAISNLSRGDAEDTGLRAVELA